MSLTYQEYLHRVQAQVDRDRRRFETSEHGMSGPLLDARTGLPFRSMPSGDAVPAIHPALLKAFAAPWAPPAHPLSGAAGAPTTSAGDRPRS